MLFRSTKPPKPALRKVYLDPMGHGEWELVRHPNGGIMGVRSKLKAKPIKRWEFPAAVRHFENLPTYYDWVFQHPNPSSAKTVPSTPPPGAPAAQGQPVPPAAGQPAPSPGTTSAPSSTAPATPPPATAPVL